MMPYPRPTSRGSDSLGWMGAPESEFFNEDTQGSPNHSPGRPLGSAWRTSQAERDTLQSGQLHQLRVSSSPGDATCGLYDPEQIIEHIRRRTQALDHSPLGAVLPQPLLSYEITNMASLLPCLNLQNKITRLPGSQG